MDMQSLVPELYCSDLAASLDFYCNVLGFSVVYDRPEAKFAFLQRESAQLMLEEFTEKDRKWLAGSLEKPYGRGISLQIDTTGIDTLYEKLESKNVTLFMDIEEKWYRRAHDTVGNKQFVVQDPDGYLLRFSETVGHRQNYAA